MFQEWETEWNGIIEPKVKAFTQNLTELKASYSFHISPIKFNQNKSYVNISESHVYGASQIGGGLTEIVKTCIFLIFWWISEVKSKYELISSTL